MPRLRWLLPPLVALLAAIPAQADRAVPADVPPPASSPAALEGSLGPLESAMLDDAADGRFDRHSLLAAALLASGVDDAETVGQHESQLAKWVAEYQDELERPADDLARARALFEFMHRRILRGGYSIACTEMTCVLDRGQFNCVSATVLFTCLAQRAGLRVYALELPGHAMSRLECEQGTVDIETTCPRWFHLADRPEERDQLVRRTTGLEPTPDPARRRPISPVQLVAMIYYNRGVDLLAAKQFPESLAANAKALRLDPASTTAKGNLLATLNNWAIALAGSRQFAPAAALLNQGLDLDPQYETFRINYAHVHRQWVEELCSEGRFDEARTVGQQGLSRLPDDPLLRSIEGVIARRSAQ